MKVVHGCTFRVCLAYVNSHLKETCSDQMMKNKLKMYLIFFSHIHHYQVLIKKIITVRCTTAKCSYGEETVMKKSHNGKSLRRLVLMVKRPYSEVSLRRKFLTAKRPYSGGHTARCPKAKCPTDKNSIELLQTRKKAR